MSARMLSQVIERSTRAQAPAIRDLCGETSPPEPGRLPAEIVNKWKPATWRPSWASGAAVGSAAALPGIGTLASLSAVAGETVVFLEATSVFVLAVADVYGIPLEERERRRALVLAVLVGERANAPSRASWGPDA